MGFRSLSVVGAIALAGGKAVGSGMGCAFQRCPSRAWAKKPVPKLELGNEEKKFPLPPSPLPRWGRGVAERHGKLFRAGGGERGINLDSQEIVILSAAKNLVMPKYRLFATLRVTVRNVQRCPSRAWAKKPVPKLELGNET